MIEIDASSGGQVFRTAIGLSAVLGKEVKISNIRKNRPKEGLFPQHLAGLKAMAMLCNARVKGDFIGSTTVEFVPGEFKSQRLNINIGTAGSVTLFLQQLLPAALLDEVQVRVFGGTDVAFAPSVNYFKEVLFPVLHNHNAKFELKLLNYGFYPKGGGSVSFKSHKVKKLKPFDLTEKKGVSLVKIFSHSVGLPKDVARSQALSAKKTLQSLNVEFMQAIVSLESADHLGSAIDVFACQQNNVCIGANAILEKGNLAQKTGKIAAKKLLQELSSNAPVDLHLADQLLPFMALAGGESKIVCAKETEHIKSNVEVIEKFLDVKFVTGQKGNLFEISVKGANFF